jgi:cytochrome c-type biogenesis protein CcmH
MRRLILLIGLIVLAVGAASAQDGGVTDDDVNRVARQLYCPVCENIPLDVCETKACMRWKSTIREKLAAGESDADIIAYFVTQFGDRVVPVPQNRGIRALLYGLPVIVGIGGGVLLIWQIVRWRRSRKAALPPSQGTKSPAAAGSGAAAPVDPYRARIERDLEAIL